MVELGNLSFNSPRIRKWCKIKSTPTIRAVKKYGDELENLYREALQNKKLPLF